MDKSKSLVIIKKFIKDIIYDYPKDAENLDKRTMKAITNAFNKAILDKRGWIWIEEDSIHSLLRVKTKADARFFLESIPKEYRQNINGKDYIRSFIFAALVSKFTEEKGSNRYLPIVNDIFNNIVNSSEVKLTKLEYEKLLKEEIKKLKHKRIKKYKIKEDELTGEDLNPRTCEFSHIRSVAMFQQYSDNIENGLIVNKETHKVITAKSINDEEQLYDLCVDKGWNTNWYDEYRKVFC